MRKTKIALLFLLCTHLLKAQTTTDTVYTQAEIMPFFAGCESMKPSDPAKRKCSNQALVQFISQNLEYPLAAQEAGVEGTVYVSFVVDETGQVVAPTLLMDIGEGCGAAALDIVGAMPDWEPAVHHGQKVKTRLHLPVQFLLRNAQAEQAEKFSLTWGDLADAKVTAQDLARNLHNPVYVRGPEGDNRYLDALLFTYSRNNKSSQAASRGDIPDDLQSLLDKVKKGGTLVITASLQDKGQFLSVSRAFEIVD